ncbi:hypothetical protein C9J03_18770 [Photobacterium gaetbulicola]|uniref:hypothetical protein n=1 Tax=Photobacterium gaetbulicola TaxID=1295392 RepID=UPI0005CC32D8|nr:hypothetical protein [Photobacterium gaetbulicola]PSU04481.1 hypothetical protein C9J03_18770 [Photobacterium gaetbulicola]
MAKSDAQRRESVTQRRKESGLKEIKMYLKQDTVDSLKLLASKIGYDEKPTNEELSKIVTALIRSELKSKDQVIGTREPTQHLIFLFDVVQHQLKLGRTHKQVVSFLSSYYEVPIMLYKLGESWNLKHISKLTNKRWVKEKVMQRESRYEERNYTRAPQGER